MKGTAEATPHFQSMEKKSKKVFWQKRKEFEESSRTRRIPEEHYYEEPDMVINPLLPPRMYLRDNNFVRELKVTKKESTEDTKVPPPLDSCSQSSVGSSLKTQKPVSLPVTKTSYYQPLIIKGMDKGQYATVSTNSTEILEEEPAYQNMSQISSQFELSGGKNNKTQPPVIPYQRVKSRETSDDESLYQNVKECQKKRAYENQCVTRRKKPLCPPKIKDRTKYTPMP